MLFFLPLANLQNGAGLQAVESHFPSLFITVEAEAWESFDPTRRGQLLDSVSSIVSANGYSGVLFKTPDGRPVARWLRERGAQLIEEREPEEPRQPDITSVSGGSND